MIVYLRAEGLLAGRFGRCAAGPVRGRLALASEPSSTDVTHSPDRVVRAGAGIEPSRLQRCFACNRGFFATTYLVGSLAFVNFSAAPLVDVALISTVFFATAPLVVEGYDLPALLTALVLVVTVAALTTNISSGPLPRAHIWSRACRIERLLYQ